MKKFIFSLTVLLTTASIGFSQPVRMLILKGIVQNSSTGEPITYATIRMPRNAVSTMTNENGRFIFKLESPRNDDSIYISHVGYKSLSLALTASDTGNLAIRLTESYNNLAEIQVKTLNGLDIVRQAIAKIPDNYPASPYRMNGFYRLSGWKENSVIDLSEAVFTTYNKNYIGKGAQFSLIKSRVDKDLTAFNGSDNVSIGLDPSIVLNFDIIGNVNESPILSEGGLKDHQFAYRGTVNYNGHRAYQINFDQKDGIKKALYAGKIFIRTDNLAFLEIDSRLSPKGINYYSWGFLMNIMLGLAHVNAEMRSDSTATTYQQFGSRYYLNHVHNLTHIYLAGGKRRFLLDPLVNKTDYLVTSIDTANVTAFQKKDVLGNKQSIESQNEQPSDVTDRFWENYNVLMAEYNVDSAVHVIQANNTTLNYKQQLRKMLSKYPKDKSLRIDSIMHFYSEKEQFSGTALVQLDGKIIYEKSFGLADKSSQALNTPQTRFRIGSTSKQFTSLLIMQLINEKRLRVEDPVRDFLPDYDHGDVTVQQLLTHQSGIANYTDNPDYLAKILNKKYTPDQLVQLFCSDSLESPPGTAFHYSNSNYVILAAILEKLTGKKYAELLQERIFQPLDMKNSFFVNSTNGLNGLATGYINDDEEKPYPVENVAGAGGITSTAEDLLKWSNALGTEKLLPDSLLIELFKPRIYWDEWNASYGYGWMIDRGMFEASKKQVLQYHPGTKFGFYDMLLRQPEKGIVIILLNNTGDFPRFDMTDLILEQLN